MRKRLLAMVLAFAMLFSTLPMAPVFAEDKCLSKDELTKQFEDAANEQFGKVGKKEGVYVGKFDPATKTVKVAILDKEKKRRKFPVRA